MEIENHKEEVPLAHYQTLLRRADPAEIAARLPFVRQDGAVLRLKLLGSGYRIENAEVTEETGAIPPKQVQTFLLRLLLEGKNEPFRGEWKTFRELPWGTVYLAPYTGRVLKRAAFSFGTRLEDFRAAAQALGGLPLEKSDAGYQFDLLGPYRLRLLLWEGDEEFPPSAQMLYSDNFGPGFAAEDRVVAGEVLIGALKKYF